MTAAVAHRRELASALVASGAVRSPWLRRAFEETSREMFVPRFYRSESGRKALVDGTDPHQHDEWLRGVYQQAHQRRHGVPGSRTGQRPGRGADLADRPARTLLEQRIRKRCLTFEEFVQHAEAFAREHDEPGTLSLRDLQRLVSGREPDTLRLATARLLERLFDEPIAALLAPPPITSSQDAGHHHMDLPLAAEAADSIVVPARTHDRKVVFVTFPRRLFIGGLGAAGLCRYGCPGDRAE